VSKSYRCADADGDFADVGEAAMFALHLPDTVQANRNDRDMQIFCEEADAALKRSHVAVFGVIHFTFGKNEHAVAAVDGFAGEAEALAEAGKLRERENVEEQGSEPVAELISPALAKNQSCGGRRIFCSDSPPMAAARRCRCRSGTAARIKPMSARRVMWFETMSTGPRAPRRFSRPTMRGWPRICVAGQTRA